MRSDGRQAGMVRFSRTTPQVLLCIAEDPGVRLREIGERVGITERAAHRVTELAAAGYVSGTRRRAPQPLHRALPSATP